MGNTGEGCMIEISDREYWRDMNYYDGILYCQLLDIGGKNDWRMPENYDELILGLPESGGWGDEEWWGDMEIWFRSDIDRYSEYFLDLINAIVPVRDI